MEKRGQVTIFIIIGLVVLLVSGLVIYFVTQREVKPLERKITVPKEIAPVYNIISRCMHDIAQKAVIKLGLQGGYIFVPPRIERNPFSFVGLDQLSILKVPYWYYENEDRSPSIEKIEKDIAAFVRDNFLVCVRNNFVVVKEQYKIEEKGDSKTRVTLTDSDVLVELDWPLEITTPEKIVRQDKFIAYVPVKLKRMFELAKKIMDEENKQEFFEAVTMKLISSDPDIPNDGLEFNCGTKKWPVVHVKERLQSVLRYNIPRIRLKGSDMVPFESKTKVYETLREERKDIIDTLSAGAETFTPPDFTPEDAFDYFSMTFDINHPAKDLKVGFLYYPDWGMLMSAQPSEGGVLKSNKIKGEKKYLKFLCINQWHFTYDIIYPLVVSIADSSAFQDKGYVFQFAFPVIIDNNEGERVHFGLKRFESLDFPSELCDQRGDNEADIRVKGFVGDSPFALDMNDVNISIRCVYEECLLGKTSNIGGIYRWKDKLPPGCINPIITASKEGYLPSEQQLTTPFLDMTLTRLMPFKYSVARHRYDKESKTISETEEKLSKKQKADIYLFLRDHGESIIKNIPTQSDDVIELPYTTYTYDVNILLRDDKDNVIGGYNAEKLNINYDELADKKKIVFHVLEYPEVPKKNEEKAEMVELVYGGKFAEKLKPTFQ